MNFLKILLGIIAFLYIISPLDFLPDIFIPWGWIDDGLFAALVIYYLWQGRLPAFFYRGQRLDGGDHRRQKEHAGGGGFEGERAGVGSGSNARADSKDPYTILGVSPGASRKEIQSAYRRAAQEYHPDKVSHLGPELQQLAKKKFMEIQEAYERLSGKGG